MTVVDFYISFFSHNRGGGGGGSGDLSAVTVGGGGAGALAGRSGGEGEVIAGHNSLSPSKTLRFGDEAYMTHSMLRGSMPSLKGVAALSSSFTNRGWVLVYWK